MFGRLTAQVAHIAEVHFGESGLDLGEQQLGYILSLDSNVDSFLAGVSLAKQTIANHLQDQSSIRTLHVNFK